MNFTKRMSIIEGWGLILILASFLWQLIETEAQNIRQEGQNYEVHKKLDALWDLHYYEYVHSPLNKNQSVIWSDFESTFDEWKIYSETKKEYEELETELTWFAGIRIFLFVLGSILLIIPKFTFKKN